MTRNAFSALSLAVAGAIALLPGHAMGSLLADVNADFSGVQGQDGWWHGFYDGDSPVAYTEADFEDLPTWNAGDNAWYQLPSYAGYRAFSQSRTVSETEGYWLYAKPDSLAPSPPDQQVPLPGDQGGWTVQRWQSNYAGPARVDLTYFVEASWSPFTARITVDDTEVWSVTAPTAGKSDPGTASVDITLSVGSWVSFSIDPDGSRGQDGWFYKGQVVAIPEPATMLLVMIGVVALLVRRRVNGC